MNLYESIKKLAKEADEDFRQHVLNDFKLFLDDHDIKEPTIQDINDYFSGFFYDLETEDDLNDMNKAEEIIRNEYKDALDDSAYEPTDEDVEEAWHWYDDDPREDWDAGRTNDYYNVAGFDKERELERLHANESEMMKESLYRDKAGESGIYSYPDLLYGKEPQSEYDRLLLQYMDTHDAIRDEIAKAVKDYKHDFNNPEYMKIRQDLEIKDRENQDLFTKAEQIPEEERGPLYQEFLKIDDANNEQFAKDRGFNSYKDYEASVFGEAENLPVYQVSSNAEDDIYVPPKSGKYLKLDDINITTEVHTNTKDSNDIKKEYHITGYLSPIDENKLPEGLSWDSGQSYFDYNVNNKEYEQFMPEEIFYYSEDNYDAIYEIENDMDDIINKIKEEYFEIGGK